MREAGAAVSVTIRTHDCGMFAAVREGEAGIYWGGEMKDAPGRERWKECGNNR